MNKYQQQLSQMDNRLFLTDGGMETTLIFHQGMDLPEFAAIIMMDNPFGIKVPKITFIPIYKLLSGFQSGLSLKV